MSGKTAVIAGATGLVGKELIRHLLEFDYYEKIIVLSRRDLGIEDNRIDVKKLADFSQMGQHEEAFDVNHVYCCLGTTMKKAGSKEDFRKIDVEYPVEMAKRAKKSEKFEQYLVVTAVGSNPDSPLFYNKVKGELEKELVELDLKGLKIFRPSLLLGHRDDFRLGEEAAKVISSIFSFFMIRSKRKLWSISGKDVARAMFQVARENKPGYDEYSPRRMHDIIQ